jgi:hypothetical protein
VDVSTFGAFFLAVAAFIGTVLFFTNPLGKIASWMRGKKKSEVNAEIKSWFENREPSEVVTKAGGFALFILLDILLSYLVEPVAVIFALVNKIGFQPLAVAMLVVIAIAWVRGVQSAMTLISQRSVQKKRTVVTEGGEQVEGTLVEDDEKIKIHHPLISSVFHFFFTLPTFYLWYLFLIAIGVLK